MALQFPRSRAKHQRTPPLPALQPRRLPGAQGVQPHALGAVRAQLRGAPARAAVPPKGVRVHIACQGAAVAALPMLWSCLEALPSTLHHSSLRRTSLPCSRACTRALGAWAPACWAPPLTIRGCCWACHPCAQVSRLAQLLLNRCPDTLHGLGANCLLTLDSSAAGAPSECSSERGMRACRDMPSHPPPGLPNCHPQMATGPPGSGSSLPTPRP